MKCPEKIVDCYPQSDASDGMGSNRLRYSWFCIRSSARSDLFLVSHEALPTMRQRLPMISFCFLTFLLLIQEHGVNNERLLLIQSVRHSKRTHSMWSHPKDCSARKNKEENKKQFFFSFSGIARSWQSRYI